MLLIRRVSVTAKNILEASKDGFSFVVASVDFLCLGLYHSVLTTAARPLMDCHLFSVFIQRRPESALLMGW